MRLSNPISPRRAISLTPLIDVVFLLLVFFMLASTFLKFTSVPVITSGSGPVITETNQIALIHVGKANRITVNAAPIAADQLQAHLASLHSKAITQAVIVVRPGATVSDLTQTLALVRRIPFNAIRVVD